MGEPKLLMCLVCAMIISCQGFQTSFPKVFGRLGPPDRSIAQQRTLRDARLLKSFHNFCVKPRTSLNLISLPEAIDEEKRIMYTAIYAAGHSLIVIPFLFFWNVEPAVKIRTAIFAFPVLVLWIALLGGWLRFS